jgi:hypothetical protein
MLWKVLLVNVFLLGIHESFYSIILLIYIIKFTLGGIEDAFRLKNELRLKFNLPRITENPSIILSQMHPATPPPNPIDIVNELQFANPNASYKRKKVNVLSFFVKFFSLYTFINSLLKLFFI